MNMESIINAFMVKQVIGFGLGRLSAKYAIKKMEFEKRKRIFKLTNGNIAYKPQRDEFLKDAESWASLSILQTREDIYRDYYLLPDKTVVTPGFYRRPTDQWLNFGLFFQDYFPNNPDYKVHLNLLYASRLPYGTPDYERPDQNVTLKPYRRVDIGLSKSLKNKSLILSILKACLIK